MIRKQHIKLSKSKRLVIFSSASLMVIILVACTGCKKLIETNPPSTTINSGNVYSSDANAIAAVTNIYVQISKSDLPGGGVTSLSLFPGLSGDELSLYNGVTSNAELYYYRNALTSSNLNNPDFWKALYQTIYQTNEAINGLTSSATLTPAVRRQLIGEAKFMRAFCYFYLDNLYGDVPLALEPDYTKTVTLPRTAVKTVYQHIIQDLGDAQNLLSDQYLNGTLLTSTSERVRPTRWAATALLARVHLYTNNFAEAENDASTIINNSLFSLQPLNSVFLKNSPEAIWQLQPVNAGWNTEEAKTFIIPSNGPDATGHPFYLSPQLLSAFEMGDQRLSNWVKSVTAGDGTYYYPYKYKSATYGQSVTEYNTVLRLSEQYLIRAEARAQQNKISEAQSDLNTVRLRAGLAATTANSQTAILTAIVHERQTELFTEWGHRWLDLKRTGKVDAIMQGVTSQKGGTWDPNWQWYPITRSELTLDPNLTQNQGY